MSIRKKKRKKQEGRSWLNHLILKATWGLYMISKSPAFFTHTHTLYAYTYTLLSLHINFATSDPCRRIFTYLGNVIFSPKPTKMVCTNFSKEKTHFRKKDSTARKYMNFGNRKEITNDTVLGTLLQISPILIF